MMCDLTRVVGLGAGGHAKVVIDILRRVGRYKLEGLLDPKEELWGTDILGVRVLGDDSLLSEIYDRGISHAFIGVGSVGDAGPRKRIYEMARREGFQIVSAVHPQATIAASVHIGHGPTIMAGALINAGARLEDNVIINTGAIVEHDCVIASHVHVATAAVLGGAVRVSQGAHIGLGASVRQGVCIGCNSIVGAGSVVVKDVPDNVVVVGAPARILRCLEE